jgi:uncharacterized protein (TIGR02266 family)
MANYWICDSENRILGPLAVGTVRELVASGRVREISKVSKDGSRWQPLQEIPEVARALAEGLAEGGERTQKFKAAEIRSRLASMRGRKAHEIFGIPRHAALDHYRTAFFRLVKPFHPDKLAEDTHPDLRSASVEMFKFLSTLMVEAESELKGQTSIPRSTTQSTQTSSSPQTQLRQKETPPTYALEEFVGIKRGPEFIEATVRVSPRNVGIFTDHNMVNLNTMGVFLPTRHHLPVGTLLDVRFLFENSPREIKARARVVWENVGVAAKMVAGFGVRFLRLDKSDQMFIQQYVDREAISQLDRT